MKVKLNINAYNGRNDSVDAEWKNLPEWARELATKRERVRNMSSYYRHKAVSLMIALNNFLCKSSEYGQLYENIIKYANKVEDKLDSLLCDGDNEETKIRNSARNEIVKLYKKWIENNGGSK